MCNTRCRTNRKPVQLNMNAATGIGIGTGGNTFNTPMLDQTVNGKSTGLQSHLQLDFISFNNTRALITLSNVHTRVHTLNNYNIKQIEVHDRN